MAKHAYCIIAHNDIKLLNTLIHCIDDIRNDIHLLIDAKSKLSPEDVLKPRFSNIRILERNIDIKWGHTSLIEAELGLFRSALNTVETPSVIHLVSGQDLPIKTQDYIHHYFDMKYPGINFIGFANGNQAEIDLKEKTDYYHPFTASFRHPNIAIRQLLKILRKITVSTEKLIGFKKTYPGLTLRKGCEWASITHDFAEYLVSKRGEILKTFKGTWACDEIYKQTYAFSSPRFRNKIFDLSDEFKGAARKIDWDRGKPYIFTKEDYDELISSDAIFARKFSTEIDPDIIKLIAIYLYK